MTDQPSNPYGDPGQPGPDGTPPEATPGHASPGPAAPGPAQPGPAQPGLTPPGPASPGHASPGSTAPGQAAPGWGTPPQQGWGAPAQPGWGVPPQQGWAPPSYGAAPPGPGGPGPYPPPYAPGQAPFGQGYAPPPKPGVVPLRPLGLGDILDGSFQSIRRNAGATLGIPVIVQLLLGLLIGVLSLPLYGLVMDPSFIESDVPDLALLGSSLTTFGIGVAAASLLSMLFLACVQGLLTIPVLRAAVNHRTRFGQAFALARAHLGRLLLLGLIWTGLSLLSLALFIGVIVLSVLSGEPAVGIPLGLAGSAAVAAGSLYVLIKLSVAAHAVVAEQRGPLAALGRSWRLTRGSWWRCFGIIALTAIIVGIATSIITTPIGFATGLGGALVDPGNPEALSDYVTNLTVLSSVVSAAVGGLAYAYQCCVTSLLYTDLRIRREGFDLALLRDADAGTDPGIPGRTPGPGGPEASPGAPAAGTA
ncbi:hypothetical protein ACQ3I4_07565 [Zafaria sp. Z1313]|uniref:hypothetical protein n=1 Tax=Zafaria sp. Z1313 TaxID=3423202 RepID=UPI003D30210C